jgi:hypothetical protein
VSEPTSGITTNFTYTCQGCGATVEVCDGQTSHTCGKSAMVMLSLLERAVIVTAVRERLEGLDWVPLDDDGPVGAELRALEDVLVKLEEPG